MYSNSSWEDVEDIVEEDATTEDLESTDTKQ